MGYSMLSDLVYDKRTGEFCRKGEVKAAERSLPQILISLLIAAALLTGAGLIAYPTVSDWWNSFQQSMAVSSYMETLTTLDRAEYESLLRAADEYNERLGKSGLSFTLDEAEKKEYDSLLRINENGIMGTIVIPKINVELPIYHGTDEAVLQMAIGHIEGSSLPVGGKSTHCIVSGHRGLPSARLFTDLDRLTEGDTFSMTVLNRTVTYEVDQIRVALPSELSTVRIEPGKDLCTLVTCTPYGINTHRLLVRGHRIPNARGKTEVVPDAMEVSRFTVLPFAAVPALLLIVLTVLIISAGNRRLRILSKRSFDECLMEEQEAGRSVDRKEDGVV